MNAPAHGETSSLASHIFLFEENRAQKRTSKTLHLGHDPFLTASHPIPCWKERRSEMIQDRVSLYHKIRVVKKET
jgi:hypothetical protein